MNPKKELLRSLWVGGKVYPESLPRQASLKTSSCIPNSRKNPSPAG